MTSRAIIWGIFAAGVSIFLLWMVGLHWNVASAMTYLTADDFSAHYQLFHNAVNGRIFQTSYVINPLGVHGEDLSYAHWFSNHVAVTAFIISPLLLLLPTSPMSLYALMNFFVFVPSLYYIYRIIQYRAPTSYRLRFMLVPFGCFRQMLLFFPIPREPFVPRKWPGSVNILKTEPG